MASQITGYSLYCIAIILGILSFLCFNISYALSSIYGFGVGFKIALWTTTIFLCLISLILFTLSANLPANGTPTIGQVLGFLVITLLIGWLILILVVYLLKYQVLYTNSPVGEKLLAKIQQQEDRFEEINIMTADGVKLQGYLFKDPNVEKAPLAIYFGGRGEEAANIAEYASRIKDGWSLAIINYRGCGFSQGKQKEELLYSDANAVYDYFARRPDIDGDNIVLISHSLGTGIAIRLSSQRDIKRVVLSAPYDIYVTGVIQDKLPLVPTKLIFTERYNSLSIAPELKIPALFLLAENDRTVLRSRSMKLFNEWGGEAQKIVIQGTHHENITLSELAWENVNKFLASLQE